jgi:hypothetical protein
MSRLFVFHGRSSAESEARFYKSTARFAFVMYPTIRVQCTELFQQSAINRLVFTVCPSRGAEWRRTERIFFTTVDAAMHLLRGRGSDAWRSW